jgi:hypothetical protein
MGAVIKSISPLVGALLLGIASTGSAMSVAAPLGEDDNERLLSHIPFTVENCEAVALKALPIGATAEIICRANEGVPELVAYTQFGTRGDMDSHYAELAEPEELSGTECETWKDFQTGGEYIYTVRGEQRGTIACYVSERNEAVMLWTDNKFKIAVGATEDDPGDIPEFVEWVLTEAGPV